jgi:hypothetical protein
MDIKGKHMDIVDKLDKNDFIIRVRPNKNKSNGAWSGSADIVVITSEHNDLPDSEWSELMQFSRMMCASVPVIEEIETFRNLVHEYLNRGYEGKKDLFVDKQEGSNIIHLNFMNGKSKNEEKD